MQHTSEVTVDAENLERLSTFIERRKEPRFSSETPVMVHAFQPNSVDSFPGHVRDVSKTGLRVRIASELPIDTKVQIVMGDDFTAVGEIRYSMSESGLFDHGISIRELAEDKAKTGNSDTPISFFGDHPRVTLPRAKDNSGRLDRKSNRPNR